jgi:hypothetical protein
MDLEQDNRADGGSSGIVHGIETLVDISERELMVDELVDLQLTLHVLLNVARQLGAALHTTEGRALPNTTCHQLERASGDLLTRRGNTDDGGNSPTLVASLEGSTHEVDVSDALECIVTASISHINQNLLDGLVAEGLRVDALGGTKGLGQLKLVLVDINTNDTSSSSLDATLDDGQADTAKAKDSASGSLLNLSSVKSGTITSGDTATQQANLTQSSLLGDLSNGDLGNDGVISKAGNTHVVEDSLSLAGETRCSIRHDTLSLSDADNGAQVGLARGAELARAALGNVQGDDMIAGNNGGNSLTNRPKNETRRESLAVGRRHVTGMEYTYSTIPPTYGTSK